MTLMPLVLIGVGVFMVVVAIIGLCCFEYPEDE